MTVLRYIIALIMLSVIIMFHELGHFLLARKNGIRVNEFSLGLGPTIIGFHRGETKYSIKALPFGGACIMEGEDDASSDERAFSKQSVWARISVVAAGPVFNFIMAFVFAVIVIGSVGYAGTTIASVSEGFPAAAAGMRSGDQIVRLNHTRVHFFGEISLYNFTHPGEEVDVTYVRDGQKHTVTLTPKYDEEYGSYLIGFTGGAYEKAGPIKTMGYSALQVRYWIKYTFLSLKMLLTGQASVNDMSGPVGLVKQMGDITAESAKSGHLYGALTMLNFAILISANLGVINLLPLPALDGGRLVFLIIEAIRKKRVLPEREAMVHFVGIMCLFALMIFIMYNDVAKIFTS